MLSSRQREVAVAVGEGLSDEAIAAKLGIAATTVHDHIQALHLALGTGAGPALVAALSRG